MFALCSLAGLPSGGTQGRPIDDVSVTERNKETSVIMSIRTIDDVSVTERNKETSVIMSIRTIDNI